MFSSKGKIKIDRPLYDRLAEAAERAGYATTEEFIHHVLDREVADMEQVLSLIHI